MIQYIKNRLISQRNPLNYLLTIIVLLIIIYMTGTFFSVLFAYSKPHGIIYQRCNPYNFLRVVASVTSTRYKNPPLSERIPNEPAERRPR